MRIRAWSRFPGLLGVLLVLSTMVLAQENYDPTPAPVATSDAEIAMKLAAEKDSLFFLDNSVGFGWGEVNFDGFLLPNGSYAKLEYAWNKLVSTTWTNILREPTEAEKTYMSHFHLSRLYVSDTKAKPAYAEGMVQVQIPRKFAAVSFSAGETNIPRQAPPITVTLLECQEHSVRMRIQGIADDEPVVVLRDAEGRRLRVETYSGKYEPHEHNERLSTRSKIAKIEVFYPLDFYHTTLNVHACTEPAIFGIEHPVAPTPRFTLEDEPLPGSTVDLTVLKAQTKIVARRTYGSNRFNTPEIAIKLPHLANSGAAQVKFHDALFYDATGKTTQVDLDHGSYHGRYYADDAMYVLRLDDLRDLSRAVGTVDIRYPGTMDTLTFTPDHPHNGDIEATFDGPIVSVKGLDQDSWSWHALTDCSQAYDATGRRLLNLGCYGNGIKNNCFFVKCAFWGTPAEIRIDRPRNWLTLSLPYDLPVAPKLPLEVIAD